MAEEFATVVMSMVYLYAKMKEEMQTQSLTGEIIHKIAFHSSHCCTFLPTNLSCEEHARSNYQITNSQKILFVNKVSSCTLKKWGVVKITRSSTYSELHLHNYSTLLIVSRKVYYMTFEKYGKF